MFLCNLEVFLGRVAMHENPCCVLFKGRNPSWREHYLLIWEQHAPTIVSSRKPMRLSYFFPFKGLTTSTSTGLRGLKSSSSQHKCSIIKFLTFPLNRNVSKLDFYSPPSTSILSPPIMEVIVLQLSSFHQHFQIPLPFRKLQGGNHLTMAKTFGQNVTSAE